MVHFMFPLCSNVDGTDGCPYATGEAGLLFELKVLEDVGTTTFVFSDISDRTEPLFFPPPCKIYYVTQNL